MLLSLVDILFMYFFLCFFVILQQILKLPWHQYHFLKFVMTSIAVWSWRSMQFFFQTLTSAVGLILWKWRNVIRMLLVLILRAHTTVLVIPHSLGMVLNAKVCFLSQKLLNRMVLIVKGRLFSAMPLFFLGLGLNWLLIHSSHIFWICHNYVNYVSCMFNARLR